MKKILAMMATLAFSVAAYSNVDCNLITYNWDMVAYDEGGDPIHDESGGYPDDNKIKVGYVYEYVAEAGGYVSEFYNGTVSFDLSPLAGISSGQILSAQIIGMSVLETGREGGVAAPSFNHVLLGTPTEICATDEITASVDITSYLKSDIDAGNAVASFTFAAPSVSINTNGVSFDKILMFDAGKYPVIAVSVAPVPEASHFAALFGAAALALAAWRRRK